MANAENLFHGLAAAYLTSCWVSCSLIWSLSSSIATYSFENLSFLISKISANFFFLCPTLRTNFEPLRNLYQYILNDVRIFVFPCEVPTDSYLQRPHTRIKWNWNRFLPSSTFNVFIDVLSGAWSSDGKVMSTLKFINVLFSLKKFVIWEKSRLLRQLTLYWFLCWNTFS